MRVLVLGFALAAGLVAQTQQSPLSLAPAAVVAALDEQVQIRFLDISLGFGISRLCGPLGHGALSQKNQTLRRLPQPGDPSWRNPQCGGRDWAPFRPRNSQEEWVAREAGKAGVEILTFLAGGARRTLEGPVVLGTKTPERLDELRRALLPRVARSTISEEDVNDWQVRVRPVRASRNECVQCHTGGNQRAFAPPPIEGLRLADAIGYVVYLYRVRR